MHVLERCPVHPKADLIAFTYPDTRNTSLVATTCFQADESIKLIFTLGTLSNHVFVTVTDGDVSHIADVLAELEEYDATKAALCLGNTYRSPNEYLKKHDLVGTVMLRADTLPILQPLAGSISIEEVTTDFLYVAFLSEAEYTCKIDRGLNALLDLFEAERKDLISI
jgi:hypothetical protein